MRLKNVLRHKENTNIIVNGNLYHIDGDGIVEVSDADATKLLANRGVYIPVDKQKDILPNLKLNKPVRRPMRLIGEDGQYIEQKAPVPEPDPEPEPEEFEDDPDDDQFGITAEVREKQPTLADLEDMGQDEDSGLPSLAAVEAIEDIDELRATAAKFGIEVKGRERRRTLITRIKHKIEGEE
jgi:hypothetical protein